MSYASAVEDERRVEFVRKSWLVVELMRLEKMCAHTLMHACNDTFMCVCT